MAHRQKQERVTAEQYSSGDSAQEVRLGIMTVPVTDSEKGGQKVLVTSRGDHIIQDGEYVVLYPDGTKQIMSQEAFVQYFKSDPG